MKSSIKCKIQQKELKEAPKRAFYSYALIDSSKLSKMLKRKQTFSLIPEEPGLADFSIFKSAIFYIGKGINARKLLHLTQAKKFFMGIITPGKNKDKLSKIVSLWKNNQGVTILQLDCNATNYEALTREYAMIEAVGLKQLSNLKQSNCYGEVCTWSTNKVMNYGDMLLFQMFKNFISRPSSPILASDVLFTPKMQNYEKSYCITCKQIRKNKIK